MIAAFLQAIRDAPDDDTPRLILADWLDENGDPLATARAELIRVQCALARWVPDLHRRGALQARERELLRLHADDWLGALRPFCLGWRFERGLAHVVLPGMCFDPSSALGEEFTRRGSELFARAWVESLRLIEAAPHLLEVIGHPLLGQLATLKLEGNGLDEGDVRLLCSSPHLRHLFHLDLSNSRLSDRAVDPLSASRHLERLTALDLRNNILTGRGIDLLLDGPLGARLRRLEVDGNDLDAGVVSRVAGRYPPWNHSDTGPSRGLLNSVGMTLALIPAGTFLMGTPDSEVNRYEDEGPARAVTLTRSFYLGVYPVTQRQYLAVVGHNPSTFNPTNGGTLDHPVENVSWEDAQRFCRRLSALPRELVKGCAYRLPTEAEWEHACRAGTRTPFWFGDSVASWQANFDSTAPYGLPPEGRYREHTTAVGSFAANPFGLYDVHGNVWEWCRDWYSNAYYRESPEVDPRGPDQGQRKVKRGGSWQSTGIGCRSGHRAYAVPAERNYTNGFRVAMSVEVAP